MELISKTRLMYFISGSTKIKQSESGHVLKEIAQFANRCPNVAILFSGYTDTDCSKAFNQKLSYRCRAE